jgi:hypothetical protein
MRNKNKKAVVIAYETYKDFARKYRIRLTYTSDGKRTPKTFAMFKKQIEEYEKKNNVRGGLYF